MPSRPPKKAAFTPQQKAMLASAAMAAVELLQDPRVREQIADAGSAVIDAVRQGNERLAKRRRSQKAAKAVDPDTTGDQAAKDAASARFGNKKLERRVQNLSENVELLRGSVDGEAADALGEVESVVARLQVAVEMASRLPLVKRMKAHREIDSVLDSLERGVFASVME